MSEPTITSASSSSNPVVIEMDGRRFAVHFDQDGQPCCVHVATGAGTGISGPWRMIWWASWYYVVPTNAARAIDRALKHREYVAARQTLSTETMADGLTPWDWVECHGREDLGDEKGAPAHIKAALSAMPGWRFVGLMDKDMNAVLHHDDEALWLQIDATSTHPAVNEIVELAADILTEFGTAKSGSHE